MTTTTLRVATFNIRNGRAFDGLDSWPFRRRATLRAIVDLDADIVGLQEVYRFQLRWLQRRLPDHVALAGSGRNANNRGEMCPLLVRRDRFGVSGVVTRWYGDAADTPGSRLPGAAAPRIAALADLHLHGSDIHIQVVNTHLDERSAARRTQSASQLLGWLRPNVPHLVLGDLNAELTDDALAVLASGDLRPVLQGSEGGTAHDFTGGTEGPQLDHILISRDWSIVGAGPHVSRSAARLPSDHWPVLAELSLDPASLTPPSTSD